MMDKLEFEELPLLRGTAELKTRDIYSGLTSYAVSTICTSIWILMFLSMSEIHYIEDTIQNVFLLNALIIVYISVTYHCMILLFSDR